MFIATLEVEHDIEHARQSDVNVLITGGDAWTRRAVAERIHRGSRRGTCPFVVLDHANPLVAGLQPLPSSFGDDRRTIDGNRQAAARSLSRRSAI